MWKRWLRRCTLGSAVPLGAFALVMASPAGKIVDAGLTAHFRAMNERRIQHNLSWVDGVEIRFLYLFIATAGRLVSPEGGQIVWHYMYGKGKPLRLDPRHLQRSPVVVRCLKTLKRGEAKRFTVRHASEDPRFAMAFNPFSLRRGKTEVRLWQWIAFKDDAETFTNIQYLPEHSFVLPDGIVHATRPVPFVAYATWSPQ